jgi:fucokinase
MVVADLEGKRIGSGGSTLLCLSLILEREPALGGLRILILHAGGDSKRLPAYGSCGKIFVPIPSSPDSTLFDNLVATLFKLPPSPPGAGQVVVAAGDALLLFDPAAVDFGQRGMIALGCEASPEEAARHGVYCVDGDGGLRLFLQKPSVEAIGRCGRPLLDIGVMSFDAASAARLMEAFQPLRETILSRPVDLYREISCALGSEATLEHYIESVRASGSDWDDTSLERFFQVLRGIPFHVREAPDCRFLHFGTTRQLIESAMALGQRDNSWVEGCRITAPLTLGGNNVIVGVDVDKPLALPAGACLDVLRGQSSWFIRCYGVDDSFKNSGGTLCARPLAEWLSLVGVAPEEIWDAGIPVSERCLWNARVFPAEKEHASYRRWLWMFQPETATPGERAAFHQAQRFSVAEMALLSDQEAFHARRQEIRQSICAMR